MQHVIRFEQGVVLLDQNIQYLRFNFRSKLYEQPSRTEQDNTLLNIEGLYSECITQMARGQPGSVEKSQQEQQNTNNEERVIFDVLTLRQQHMQDLIIFEEKKRIPQWVKTELANQLRQPTEGVFAQFYNILPALPSIFQTST